MSRRVLRRHVSMPGLLACARELFAKVPDPVRGRLFSLADCLMSGLAIFTLKFPSLLKYDEPCRGGGANTYIQYNLRTLFGVQLAPATVACARGWR